MVCLGNRWRSDDAAGLAVAERLRGRLPEGVELVEHEGEPTSLIETWAGADAVWLVDAVAAGGEPGRVHRLDASAQPLPVELFRTSTHHVSLAEAVELARALGRLPPGVHVVGIEGTRFTVGEELTPPVAAAVEPAAQLVLDDVTAMAAVQ